MGILEAATQRMKMEEARYEEQIAALKAENERLAAALDDADMVKREAIAGYAAAERALAERAGGVKVKALEWDRRSVDGSTEYADSLLGEYQAWAIGGSGYFYRKAFATGQLAGDTIETAKAAAQADYERRILSTLEPAAPEGRQEAVAWRWKPKDSAAWIYDPKHEWLEAQSSDEIDAEPLYTRPAEQAVTKEIVEALRNIDAEAPAKEPRDDWTSTDLDEAFYEGKLRGFWEMAVYAREALTAALEAGRHD